MKRYLAILALLLSALAVSTYKIKSKNDLLRQEIELIEKRIEEKKIILEEMKMPEQIPLDSLMHLCFVVI
jgi:hypothetical protein